MKYIKSQRYNDEHTNIEYFQFKIVNVHNVNCLLSTISAYHEYGKNPMALSCRPSGFYGPYTMDRNNYIEIHPTQPNPSTNCKNFISPPPIKISKSKCFPSTLY